MKYDIQRSLLYDTIRYFNIIYNKREINDYIFYNELDFNEAYFYFNQVDFDYKYESKYSALFHITSKKSLVNQLFIDNTARVHNISDYIAFLRKNDFQSSIFDFYFSYAKEKCDSELLDRLLAKSDLIDEIKESIRYIYHNSSETLIYLEEILLKAHSAVDKMYRENTERILTFNGRYAQNKKFIISLESNSKWHIKENTVYMVSLLHVYGCKYFCAIVDEHMITYFFLGILCYQGITDYSTLNLTVESVKIVTCNELLLNIIEYIKARGKDNLVPSSDIRETLSEEYGYPYQRIYQGLRTLMYEKALISIPNGRKLEYKINPDYFEQAAKIMYEYLKGYNG